MKHKPKITIILLAMFVITQFIGLAVLHADIFHIEQEVNGTIQKVSNPQLSWIQPPEVQEENEFFGIFPNLVVAFVIAVLLLFFLSKFEFKVILKAWFFIIICVALFLSIYAFEKLVPFKIDSTTALIVPALIALPLAFFKIYKRNFLIHNITEFFIYPGIACVFVPILNIWTIFILLILISLYDIWAVWHSGIMQKMAKYQTEKLNIFAGFFVPYYSKKLKEKIKKMKSKFKKTGKKPKNKNIKVNVAMLGGGDIVFPIITAGVLFKTKLVELPFGLSPFQGGLIPALFIIFGATLGLMYLFLFSEKKKFYPAMPFITSGIFIGIILSYIIQLLF
jgi:presenilin-like A22 family membrane protease